MTTLEAIKCTKTHRNDGYKKLDLRRLSKMTEKSVSVVYADICELRLINKVEIKACRKYNYIREV